MHQIQKILLKRLLISNNQKYSLLTQGYGFEDNVVFHLKQLLNKHFIEKQKIGYKIITKGVKQITRYDLEKLENTGFKTFFVGFVCKSGKEYLVKEHPASKTNFYNLPSGKPRFGESIEKALTEIFCDNTGLKLKYKDFRYLALHLKTVKTSKGEVLFDDALAVYETAIDESQKLKMKLNKQLKWMPFDEIKKLPNRWPEIDILIIDKNFTNFLSYEFMSDYIL